MSEYVASPISEKIVGGRSSRQGKLSDALSVYGCCADEEISRRRKRQDRRNGGLPRPLRNLDQTWISLEGASTKPKRKRSNDRLSLQFHSIQSTALGSAPSRGAASPNAPARTRAEIRVRSPQGTTSPESVSRRLRSRRRRACRSLVSPLLSRHSPAIQRDAGLLNPADTVTPKGGHDLLPVLHGSERPPAEKQTEESNRGKHSPDDTDQGSHSAKTCPARDSTP
jgi:hypothetical protein